MVTKHISNNDYKCALNKNCAELLANDKFQVKLITNEKYVMSDTYKIIKKNYDEYYNKYLCIPTMKKSCELGLINANFLYKKEKVTYEEFLKRIGYNIKQVLSKQPYYPKIEWESAILKAKKAIEKYITENNRIPNATEFNKLDAPCSKTFTIKWGIYYKDLLNMLGYKYKRNNKLTSLFKKYKNIELEELCRGKVQEFIDKNARIPTYKEFKNLQLPCHKTIRKRFDKTYTEFLQYLGFDIEMRERKYFNPGKSRCENKEKVYNDAKMKMDEYYKLYHHIPIAKEAEKLSIVSKYIIDNILQMDYISLIISFGYNEKDIRIRNKYMNYSDQELLSEIKVKIKQFKKEYRHIPKKTEYENIIIEPTINTIKRYLGLGYQDIIDILKDEL